MPIQARILDLSFQAAVLNQAGLQAALSQAAASRGIALGDRAGLEQPEVVQHLLETGVEDQKIREVLSSVRSSLDGDYRRSAASPESFQSSRRIVGYEMIGLPGGWAIEAERDGRFDPQWRRLSPYWLGKSPLTRAYFSELQRLLSVEPERPRWSHREDEPVTGLNRIQHEGLPRVLSAFGEAEFRLPTVLEWEVAARGPAVDVTRDLRTKIGAFKSKDFGDLVRDRFELFFFEFGGPIFGDPWHPAVLKRLEAGQSVYGYRAYATASGAVVEEELPPRWTPTPETTPVAKEIEYRTCEAVQGGLMEVERDLPLSLIAPADWGPTNVFGFHQMIYGVLNLVSAPGGELVAKGGPQPHQRATPISNSLPLLSYLFSNRLGVRLAATTRT